MSIPSYEKLGAFYLGRRFDLPTAQLTDEPILYDSKDLTTHAVIVGMTGSGKTGLAIGLLEEAAMDGIPVIAIDPKGDLGNILLSFPDLSEADFRPWINEDTARQKGLDPDAYARDQAETWRKGLADWDQDGERIRRMAMHFAQRFGREQQRWARRASAGFGAAMRGGKMLADGDLRLIVLLLLEEAPRHGYDIIKALGDK